MKKKWLILPLLGILLLSAFTRRGGSIDIRAYLYDPCGGCFTGEGACRPCDAVDAMTLRLFELAEQGGFERKVTITVRNLKTAAGERECREACERLGIVYESLALPLFVVGGKRSFQGDAQIAQAVAAAERMRFPFRNTFSKEAAEKDTVYFYSEMCADCARCSPAITAARERGVPIKTCDIDTPQGLELFEGRRPESADGKGLAVPALVMEETWYIGSSAVIAALEE